MNSEDFNSCREFIQSLLSKTPESTELLAAYVKLIELKSAHDLATHKAIIEKELKESEYRARIQETLHTNNTNFDIAAHTNNTNSAINANNNWAQTQQQHTQQWHSSLNTAMQNNLLPPYR